MAGCKVQRFEAALEQPVTRAEQEAEQLREQQLKAFQQALSRGLAGGA